MGMQYDSGEFASREIAVNDAIVRSHIGNKGAYFIDNIGPTQSKKGLEALWDPRESGREFQIYKQ